MEAEAHMRWESETRYYTVVLHRDLLEDWVLTIAHGGRGNRLGALIHRAVASKEAGLEEIKAISKTREKHGYALVLFRGRTLRRELVGLGLARKSRRQKLSVAQTTVSDTNPQLPG